MAAILKQTEIAGETFIRMNGALLVASQSEPGVWHQITDAHCTCKGFAYRGYCRHIKASLELETEVKTERAIVEHTDLYGSGWVVNWGGFLHGGIHTHREDADAHAQALREAPDWDYAEWLERNGYGQPEPPTPTPSRRESIPFPDPKSYAVQKEAW